MSFSKYQNKGEIVFFFYEGKGRILNIAKFSNIIKSVSLCLF